MSGEKIGTGRGGDVAVDVRLPSTAPAPVARPRRALWTRRLPWWAELALAVAAYELYDVVQGLTAGDRREAVAHGLAIERLERHLHLWVEPSVNRFVTAHQSLSTAAGYYYAVSHVLVTFLVLGFLWARRPEGYVRLRNTLITMSLLALVVFWRWPVAPPRLAVGGLTDTLVQHDILGAAHAAGGLVNVYAAMPSLHVAWAVWCAGALVVTGRGPRRHLAWLYPVLTTLVVVGTANHFILDAAAGALLSVATLAGARWSLTRHGAATGSRSLRTE